MRRKETKSTSGKSLIRVSLLTQAQLGLSSGQRAALKQVHRRLVDQLLNVTAERFHVSAMLKVCT